MTDSLHLISQPSSERNWVLVTQEAVKDADHLNFPSVIAIITPALCPPAYMYSLDVVSCGTPPGSSCIHSNAPP